MLSFPERIIINAIKYAGSLYDTYLRPKALYMKHYNSTQPNLIMCYIAYPIHPTPHPRMCACTRTYLQKHAHIMQKHAHIHTVSQPFAPPPPPNLSLSPSLSPPPPPPAPAPSPDKLQWILQQQTKTKKKRKKLLVQLPIPTYSAQNRQIY